MIGSPAPVRGRAWLIVALGAAAAGPVAVEAQTKPDTGGGPAIYTCIDDKGRRLTSDRPIPECLGREQRVLNKDGSLRSVRPPPLTADERAEKDAADRRVAAERAAQADAIRRDRNLMMRYPDEASHRKAREKALDTVRAAVKATEKRLADLSAERKPLDDEAEFYIGKPLPAGLKQQIDANEAAVEAQKSLAQTQAAELVRINALYDAEIERLRRLWAGAPPGSLGPTGAPSPVRPAASAAAR